MNKVFTATNWSEPEDDFSVMFYEQNTSQYWLPSEIPVLSDINSWKALSDDERWVFIHASAGLNALDTLQGEVGMYELKKYVQGHVPKATIQFQAMMEDIHAMSYSMMNRTFLSVSEEKEVFSWVQEQKHLQYKMNYINSVFTSPDDSPAGVWKKMVISCMLETALFYSGFFYPLYLAGQGKMTNAAEIFRLIIRD